MSLLAEFQAAADRGIASGEGDPLVWRWGVTLCALHTQNDGGDCTECASPWPCETLAIAARGYGVEGFTAHSDARVRQLFGED